MRWVSLLFAVALFGCAPALIRVDGGSGVSAKPAVAVSAPPVKIAQDFPALPKVVKFSGATPDGGACFDAENWEKLKLRSTLLICDDCRLRAVYGSPTPKECEGRDKSCD